MKLGDLNEKLGPKTRWAVGPNADKAYGFMKGFLKRPNVAVVWVHIGDLFSKTGRGFRLDPDDPSGGENSIGKRVERAKQHWAEGGYMNPGDAIVDENGVVQWGDGRHRMVAAWQLGQEYAPIAMERQYLDNLERSGIRTKDPNA